MVQLLRAGGAVLLAMSLLVFAQPVFALAERLSADVQALLAGGPRVAGSPAAERASAYLSEQYRSAGYEVEIQPFSFEKFNDLGSSLIIEGERLKGRALSGSPAGSAAAAAVVVPGVGEAEDFARVDAKGAVAIVRRGKIPFLEKARHAARAGAVGLVVVNSQDGPLMGTLGGKTEIPVLGFSGSQGRPLLMGKFSRPVQLEVRTEVVSLTGRNVIARLGGVRAPQVLLGAHYDSVEGAPGANDNASGSAVLLESARRLVGTPLARRAWFVHFDAEEEGLIGSRHFVRSASAPFIKGLRGMLNFDMVGLNQKLLVGGTPELVALVEKSVPAVEKLRPSNASDHASFAAAKVPVLFFYRGQDPNYHQPGDKQVDPQLLEATVEAALGTVGALLPPALSESPERSL
ncbi:M28 family peptidase [Gloeobacter morelensis]|nr:M28 family peptidase [Gloeobacter morelensis]